LLPSFFLSRAKEDVIHNQAKVTERSIAVREQEARATVLVEAKQKLEIFFVRAEHMMVSEIFDAIVMVKSRGVQINGLFFHERGVEESEIVIEGISSTREALLSFKRSLEQESIFSLVDLPISNLASDKDIEFTIRTTGNF